MSNSGFMGSILSGLEATGHHADFILAIRQEFERIAGEHPELVERYWRAFANRDAGEIERLLVACRKLMRDDVPSIGNIRVNAVTGRFHVGNGHRNAAIFPADIRYH